jgi:prepilin-type processing-associated H-X9-DG protein
MNENPYTSPGGAGGMSKQRKGPNIWVGLLTVFGIGILLVFLFLPVMRTAGPAAFRNQCANNLKQIALALRSYEVTYHALPPAYTVDADGKPLHSWRTLILPFLEEGQLYKKIDLSKPWDDPANAEACKTVLLVFHCPAEPSPANNHTTYLGSVAPNGCFRLTEPRHLSDIHAPSQTLMVIEVPTDHSVPWMAPKDADEQLVLNIGSDSNLPHAGGVNAAFVDGSVRLLEADFPAVQRRAMISIAGHDKASDDK